MKGRCLRSASLEAGSPSANSRACVHKSICSHNCIPRLVFFSLYCWAAHAVHCPGAGGQNNRHRGHGSSADGTGVTLEYCWVTQKPTKKTPQNTYTHKHKRQKIYTFWRETRVVCVYLGGHSQKCSGAKPGSGWGVRVKHPYEMLGSESGTKAAGISKMSALIFVLALQPTLTFPLKM